MVLISTIKINGYRKFSNFQLNNLSRINFFVGNNNVGKTTILEAVYGLASGRNLSPFFWTGIQRKSSPQNFTAYHIADNIVSSVNNKTNIPFKFELSAIDDDKEINFAHTILLGDVFKDFVYNVAMNNTISNNAIPTDFGLSTINNFASPNNIPLAQWDIIGSDGIRKSFILNWPNLFIENVSPQKLASFKDISAHRNMDENRKIFTYLKRQNLLKMFITEMQSIFPEIEDIDILPYQDNSLAPVSIKAFHNEYFPLDTFGDGLRRLYQIIGSLIFYRNSIICIDEIDATLHPQAQGDLCRYIILYARKYNVQMFVTTHNLEFIDNFLRTWNTNYSTNDDVRIITMKNNDNSELRIRTMTGEQALSARDDFQLELR